MTQEQKRVFPEITEKTLKDYLKEHHHLESPESLFTLKETDKDRYMKVVNEVFKTFIHHWMDDRGNLVTEDPDNPIFMFEVWGYPGYLCINSLEDLLRHLLYAKTLRDNKIREIKRLMGS